MPLNSKALSPSTATTGCPVSTAAAMAYPMPTPITPQVPVSRRCRGTCMSMTLRAKSSALAPFDEIGVRVGAQHVPHRPQGAAEPHGVRVGGQPFRHLRQVLLGALGEFVPPGLGYGDPPGLDPLHQRADHGADVPDQRRGDGLVAVQLGGLDVDLDELRVRTAPSPPWRTNWPNAC